MHANPHTPLDAERERHRADSDVDTNTHMDREAHRKLQTYKHIQAQTELHRTQKVIGIFFIKTGIDAGIGKCTDLKGYRYTATKTYGDTQRQIRHDQMDRETHMHILTDWLPSFNCPSTLSSSDSWERCRLTERV